MSKCEHCGAHDHEEKEENLKIIDKKIKELEETIRANNSLYKHEYIEY